MRTLARPATTCVVAIVMTGLLFASGCGQSSSPTAPTSPQAPASSSAAGPNGPPAQAPLVNVAVTLSKNPANAGDIVTVTAHATVRATGVDVPSQPGELIIQACLGGINLNTYLPAAACTSSTPTGLWEDLNLSNQTPAVVTFAWDTTGDAGKTIGFRGHYTPRGSGLAGGNSPAVDLVIKASTPPPPPPPPPPPSATPLGGTYLGSWTWPAFCNPNPAACSGGVDFGEVYVTQTDTGIGVIQTTGKFRLSFQTLFGGCQFEIDVASGGSFTSTGASIGNGCASYLTFSGTLNGGHLALDIFAAGQLGWTFSGSRQ